MGGQSIGDLFIKLGFEVDDTKLKSFDESIKSAFSTVLKFGGITASVGGFIALAKGASDTALQIQNMTAVFGVSARSIQAWGAAVHENNPLKSYAEGIASFGAVAQYLSNAAFTPQGATALNRLGVQFSAGDIQHPEKIIDKLFESLPRLLAQHPENRSLYSGLVGQLTGDPANIQIFERGRAFADAAASRITVLDEELQKEAEARRSIAALGDSWDKFVAHVTASLSPYVTGVLNAADQGNGFWGGLKNAVSYVGEHSSLNSISDYTGKKSELYINNKNDSEEFWEAHGYTRGQVAGWLAQEHAESSYNPRATNGKYRGLFQWSPERAAAILKGTGIDINTANHWQQLQAAEWEFRHMGLEDQFRKTGSSSDASAFLSKKFEIHEKYNQQHGDETAYRARMAEQMAMAPVNITQHITSNADAQEVARVANSRIQDTLLTTYLQQIGVNP